VYEVDRSSKTFRRSVRRVAKREYDMVKLEHTITLLATGDLLPPNYKDHPLKGSYQGYRECHVEGENDWLLVYQKDDAKLILILTVTGTHTDLFD
jgi:mRNA interferase YafQ